MTSRRAERAGKKLRREDCGKIEEIGDFLCIDLHKMETNRQSREGEEEEV
jgi:hypothetical protein